MGHRHVPASIAAILVIAASATVGCDRSEPERQAPAFDLEAGTDTAAFRLEGTGYTVIADVLRHAGEETVRRFRIIDEGGVVQFEEEQPEPEAAPHGFRRTVAVAVHPVSGASGAALLLERQQLPSAPLTGVTLQLLGERDGRLQPLAPPLSYYGVMQEPSDDGAGTFVLDEGDLLYLDLWRYHFGATLPLRLRLSCMPGSDRCIEPAPGRLAGDTVFGTLDVTVNMREPEAGEFITLYAEPGAESGQRVPVHADSDIQVVEAAARVSLRSSDTLDVILRNEHLRIRIDGREGWIRGPEAFEAIGLPAAG